MSRRVMPRVIRARQCGMSLVELLVGIAIAGILAVVTLPQFLTGHNQSAANVAGQVDQMMQQIAIAVDQWEDKESTPVSGTTLDWIFYKYGIYFAYKGAGGGNTYFMLNSGARITQTPALFSAATLPEYTPAPITDLQWNSVTSPAVPGYCGNFPAGDCIYLDINGRQLPNRAGRDGDLIPLRMDPDTHQIRTLYQWMLDETPLAAERCEYVSIYDVLMDAPGANACP